MIRLRNNEYPQQTRIIFQQTIYPAFHFSCFRLSSAYAFLRHMCYSNPYKTDGTRQFEVDLPKPFRSKLLAIGAIVLAFLTASFLHVTQQNFAKIFAEFEIKLPPLTMIVCSPFLPLLHLAIALVSVVISVNPSYHRLANRWNAMVVAFSTMTFVAYVLGMFSLLYGV